ncbi:MAG: riboflavin synthase [Akkermansiaceae bacterium]|nr:riboflavin synthase [Akkermansiaceae bacterium]NNM30060.1 riboflavin synthase [Akkermansiaceae bacterium]
MFTGLIEDVGTVQSLERHGEQARLVTTAAFAGDLAVGDSVAVNGCCLTATARDATTATFDLLARTLELTSLGELATGSPVNLERALAANARLGGHFVQGHVDATGEILDLSPRGQDHRLEVSLPTGVQRYCVERGSLAVDGISLTIAEVLPASAVFWIIPHTFAATNLQAAAPGQRLNLEADLLAKYAEKLLAR